MLPKILLERRKLTDDKLKTLVEALEGRQAAEIVTDRACVYATGSLGRGEMSEKSDLDVFVLRDKSVKTPLTNLDEIRLTARLVEVAREQGYPDFSGDGKYIRAHDVKEDLIGKLGTHEDDYVNVFTARMLLLLESRPVLGGQVYERAISDVVAEYWRDYAQNSIAFLPVFLMNDILRFWKTLCLNYEDRTGAERTKKRGKRRLHNYKLKHSRLLTCYSGIIYLQAILGRDNGTVSPEAALEMVGLSPTARLERVSECLPDTKECIGKILERYAQFLNTSSEDKQILESKFEEPNYKQERLEEAKDFGNQVFELLQKTSSQSELMRYLVV